MFQYAQALDVILLDELGTIFNPAKVTQFLACLLSLSLSLSLALSPSL